MRRSHSSSNIPLSLGVHNQNRRDSKTREYGKPASRTSRERSLDNQTPLTQYRHRLIGTDKKYSAQKNLLKTPTTPRGFPGFKRSSSLSSFGSRVSITRNKSPGDKKTFQKQVNDKKWIAEQYAKVQNFIESRGFFNPELADKIRPPTMAIFIELISALFRQIIKTVPLNVQNYGDVVMQTLKLLRYPGQITASTFKTVNTMHGWPQFIAIISWLIDRVDLEAVHSAFREQQDEDVKVTFSMYDAVFEFLTTQHYIMLPNTENTPDEEFLLQSEDKLYEDMLKITGTDQEAALQINEKLEIERGELEGLRSKLKDIEDENLKIHAENLERQNFIDKYEESKGNREQEVKEELAQLKKTLNKYAENKADLLLSIKKLEDTILTQSCKFKEKTQFLSQIEDLKRVIERKERKLAEYRVVRDDLDMELRTLVTEIESKVDKWNVSITKTFLPELKSLCLREKGFHSTGFLQEIVDIHKKMEELQEKLLKEFDMCQCDIEKLLKQREVLLESNKLMESTKGRLIDLKQIIESFKEQERTMISDLEACKSNHEINMKKIEESYSSKINEQEKVLKELTNKKQKLTESIDKTSKKGLSVIIEAHNMVIQNMKKIEDVALSKVNDANMSLKESQQNLQLSLDHMLSLKKITAQMYQLADVHENKENLPNN